MTTKIESVFICPNDDTVINTESKEQQTCTVCSLEMEMTGTMEHAKTKE